MNKQSVILLLVLIGCVIAGCASMDYKETASSASQCFDNASGFLSYECLFKLKDTNLSTIQEQLVNVSDNFCNSYEKFIDNSIDNRSICDALIPIIPLPIHDRAVPLFTGNGTIEHLKKSPNLDNEIIKYLNLDNETGKYIIPGDNTTNQFCRLVIKTVVIPGIDKARNEIKDNMTKEYSQPSDKNTIEGLIADVIRYHGACSLDAGIASAQKSINLQSHDISNISLDTLKSNLEKYGYKLELKPK